jgi:lipopolysaccharide exporter
MDPRTGRGVLWTVASFGANRVVTVITTILLARLLVPSDFGLFALATIVVNFISYFSSLGLGQALILGKDVGRRVQGTVLTLLIAFGVVFAVGLAAASPLVADLMGQPRLEDILFVIAGVLSFTGANWFYDALLQKELAFRERFICQLVRTIVYAVVALSLAAFADLGVWAMIAGFGAGHVGNGVALLVLSPYLVRPRWDRAVAGEYLRTGAGFVLQGAVAFAQRSVDYVLVGRILGATQLGYYTLAFRQAELPFFAIGEPTVRVLFPSFAEMRHRELDTRSAYLTALRLMALASFPLAAILSGAADPYVEFFFGEKWLPMIGVLQVLGLWSLVQPIAHVTGWYLNSHERAALVGRVALLLLVALVGALYVAAELGDIETVAWVMVAHSAVAGAILMVLAHRETAVAFGQQLRVLAGPAAGAAAAWLVSRAIADGTESLVPFISLAAATAGGLAAYAGAVRVVAPGLMGDAAAKLRAAARRGPLPAEP